MFKTTIQIPTKVASTLENVFGSSFTFQKKEGNQRYYSVEIEDDSVQDVVWRLRSHGRFCNWNGMMQESIQLQAVASAIEKHDETSEQATTGIPRKPSDLQ